MLDKILSDHISTYDLLADEYEQRVDKLSAVTNYTLSYLIKELPKHAKVLDIGCGVGYTTEILNNSGMLADGIDISPRMVEYAKKRNPESKIVVGDFLTEKYEAGSYDGVLMYAFIHLFPYETAVKYIEKTTKLLKPRGVFFIGTTKSSRPSEGYEEKSDYSKTARRFRKRWTPEELEKLLNDNGLIVKHKEDIKDEFGKIWMDYVAGL